MLSFIPFHTRIISNEKQHAFEDKRLDALLDSERKIGKEWVQLADDRRIAANQLKLFGQSLDDDMTDVTSKLGDLMIEWSKVMADFAGQSEQYQLTIQSMAEKKTALLSHRAKRARLEETIQKHEMASKMDIIASFGKHLVDVLDVTPIQPGGTRPSYHGTEYITRIVKDTQRAITHWHPDSTTTTTPSHHSQNPRVVVAPASDVGVTAVEDKVLLHLVTGTEEEQHPSLTTDSTPQASGHNSPRSFHSTRAASPVLYKPDEVTVPNDPASRPMRIPLAPMEGPHHGSPLGPGGFSPFFLEHRQQHLQQHMDPFHPHSTDPGPYKDMTHHQQYPLHASPQHTPFYGPGGFVLPPVNHHFALASSPPHTTHHTHMTPHTHRTELSIDPTRAVETGSFCPPLN